MSRELDYEVDVDSSEVAPFVAKMGRLIDSVRDVFGDQASMEFDIDADVAPNSAGALALRPYCKSLEVRR